MPRLQGFPILKNGTLTSEDQLDGQSAGSLILASRFHTHARSRGGQFTMKKEHVDSA